MVKLESLKLVLLKILFTRKNKDRDLLFAVQLFILQTFEIDRAGQPRSQDWELHLGLTYGQQGPKVLALISQYQAARIRSGAGGLHPGTPIWNSEI